MLTSGALLVTGKNKHPSKTPFAKESLWLLSSLGFEMASHMLASMQLFQSDNEDEQQ